MAYYNQKQGKFSKLRDTFEQIELEWLAWNKPNSMLFFVV